MKLNLRDQNDKQYWLGLGCLSLINNIFFSSISNTCLVTLSVVQTGFFGLSVSGFEPKMIYKIV